MAMAMSRHMFITMLFQFKRFYYHDEREKIQPNDAKLLYMAFVFEFMIQIDRI